MALFVIRVDYKVKIGKFDKRWHILVDDSQRTKLVNNWEPKYFLIANLDLIDNKISLESGFVIHIDIKIK